ncbi:hypothetical protein BC936DRAFT_136540 [Jimgerdemannia flammicorona]|uniref:Uncharacterized protein n=1 Tax=Jimgerdemannia flammicorona TaxID=994334 RepID=A0A433CZA4_9FUNG|nr:hypothetical protein BC936DRAFT_136540 [Jimgerdemannia flammicorona]
MESYHHELYLIGSDSDHKTVISTDILCSAVAYEAVQAYERYKHAHRLVDNHKKSIQYINGYTIAKAIKLFKAHHNCHVNPEEKQQIAAHTAVHI